MIKNVYAQKGKCHLVPYVAPCLVHQASGVNHVLSVFYESQLASFLEEDQQPSLVPAGNNVNRETQKQARMTMVLKVLTATF